MSSFKLREWSLEWFEYICLGGSLCQQLSYVPVVRIVHVVKLARCTLVLHLIACLRWRSSTYCLLELGVSGVEERRRVEFLLRHKNALVRQKLGLSFWVIVRLGLHHKRAEVVPSIWWCHRLFLGLFWNPHLLYLLNAVLIALQQ